jgi:DnaK suppressor protein
MAGKVQKKTNPRTGLQKKFGLKTKPAVNTKAQVKSTHKAAQKTKPKTALAVRLETESKAAPMAKAKSIMKAKETINAVTTGKNRIIPDPGVERNERLRRLLIQKRQEILKESKTEIKKYVAGEKRQLVETVLDEGDLSVVDLAEDINLKQLSTHRDTLQKIDIALRKFDEGTYGTCDECGDEISVERLLIMPFAIMCRDCQEEREMREKIEKENAPL